MSLPSLMRSESAPADGTARGTWLVVGLVLLGVAAAVTGVWFQRAQTRRCLEFYGPAEARRIAAAPTVELLLVQVLPPGKTPRSLTAVRRIDVSKAAGLVHLRRGLVEDANFRWAGEGTQTAGSLQKRLPPESWDVAFVFADDDGGRPGTRTGASDRTTIVLDLDPAGGHLAVVGKPGRIGLGRIGPGLDKWIRSTLASAR